MWAATTESGVSPVSAAISARTKVFLSTYVVDKDSDGGQWSFLFHRSRDFFSHVSRIITDNAPLAERAVALEGLSADKFLVHHQVVASSFVPRLFNRKTYEVMKRTAETSHRILCKVIERYRADDARPRQAHPGTD